MAPRGIMYGTVGINSSMVSGCAMIRFEFSVKHVMNYDNLKNIYAF